MTDFRLSKFLQAYAAYRQAASCLSVLTTGEAEAMHATLCGWALSVAGDSQEALRGRVVVVEGLGGDNITAVTYKVEAAPMAVASDAALISPAEVFAGWSEVASGPVRASTESAHWTLLAELAEQTMTSVRQFLTQKKGNSQGAFCE